MMFIVAEGTVVISLFLLPPISKLAVLLNLSYNNQNRTQINAVFPAQKEMDRVGVEPTTSAMPATFYL
jgi:hypothetical protein